VSREGRAGAGRARATTSTLSAADELVRVGRVRDAIDRLADANRARRDPAIEIRLLQLRQDAVCSLDRSSARSPWPPVYDDPFPETVGCLPEVHVADLNAEVLGGAVAHHGGLIVRNLLELEDARRIIDGIHRAEAQRHRIDDDVPEDEGASWYTPYPASHGVSTRGRVQRRGGIWMADSPANTALVLDLLVSRGVIGAVARHLGERPCFSLQKSTLRRLPPVFSLTGWHQDGAFLGSDVRTMNVWTALSPCGGDRPTPGLELVPKRLSEILSTEGGMGPISIAPALLDLVAADAPPVRPEFEPGDGLMFDERFLHQTYLHENMTDDRYALECWLFAPSHSSPDYLPFLV
jgi:hypothetical protein